MRVLAFQPEFCDPGHLGETDRFDVLAAQAKLLAASAEIRAGAGPNTAIQRDDVTAAFAVHRPAAVAQGRHLHLAAPQGSLRPGRTSSWSWFSRMRGAVIIVFIFRSFRVNTNVWGLVSDVDCAKVAGAPTNVLLSDVFPLVTSGHVRAANLDR